MYGCVYGTYIRSMNVYTISMHVYGTYIRSMNVRTVSMHVYGSIVCVYVEVYPHVHSNAASSICGSVYSGVSGGYPYLRMYIVIHWAYSLWLLCVGG